MDSMIPGEPSAQPDPIRQPDTVAEFGAEEAVLSRAVRRLARTSVMVIGDVMLDRYVYGVVDRVSPEAPIPSRSKGASGRTRSVPSIPSIEIGPIPTTARSAGP